ncbi:hypothetical protein H072_4752 [Dactylellina haptotyla CBS 200.50]|uniref:Major facilitator superfamily (MFS) profile domain-containing protein n=1 Tax=Dactylellina haptotyla (strain CBS 200.50) TaxID=1284197 RepID=S8BPJ9_DACHA|nr:hypothetical protein H072_4752 [Dactylellina haptotyla CBS 200.50]
MISTSSDIEKQSIVEAAETAAPDADIDSTSGAGVTADNKNATKSTHIPTRLRRIVTVLSYTPRRCRYDPEKQFHFNLALNVLFAFAATFTVANLYYNHPILNVLAQDFNVSYEKVSVIPNVMQAGYASGLFFITPLGDMFRRRALTLGLIVFTTSMWLGCTLTKDFNTFAGLSFVVGLTTVTPQLMLPLVGDLAPEGRKATAIAIVSSGLQLGLLLARVLSGIITQYSSWRTVYWLGFGVQALIFCLLWLFMPDYPPKNRGISYPRVLLSMLKLIPKHPLLVQASLNGGFLSATFMLYWTTLTFLLASPPYQFSSSVVGLFGLIGIAAVLTTPWIGRYVIDRWHPQLSVIAGSVVILVGQLIGTYAGKASVSAPVLQAWLIDIGISTCQVANRSGIYQLDASSRNRINSVYMLSVFIGQVLGTGIGAKTYAIGGWIASGSASVGITVLGLLVALGRGPHSAAWFGWDGGSSFKLRSRTGDEGRRAEEKSGPEVDRDSNITSGTQDEDSRSVQDQDTILPVKSGAKSLEKTPLG